MTELSKVLFSEMAPSRRTFVIFSIGELVFEFNFSTSASDPSDRFQGEFTVTELLKQADWELQILMSRRHR